LAIGSLSYPSRNLGTRLKLVKDLGFSLIHPWEYLSAFGIAVNAR